MKAFLEEYGFVILIAIVIILLIVMATPVGNSIKASILGLVDRFSNTATSKLDKADQGDFTANLRQAGPNGSPVVLDINSDSKTDKYSYTITYVSGGRTATSASVTFDNGDTTSGANKAGNGSMNLALTALKPDNGSELYVTVTNEGTNESVNSNTIKYHQ